MRVDKKKYASLLIAISTAATLGCGRPGQDQINTQGQLTSHRPIFTDIVTNGPGEMPRPSSAGIQRERYVHAEVEQIKSIVDQITATGRPATSDLNFFKDLSVKVEFDRVQKLVDDDVVLFGRIAGERTSSVTLVMRDGSLRGQFKSGAETRKVISIHPIGKNLHVIQELSSQDGRGDSEVIPPIEEIEDTSVDEDAGLPGFASSREPAVIDVLVAYTPRAKRSEGGENGIRALIAKGIEDANRAFADSGANARVRLVGTLELDENESSNVNRDLYALQGKRDGRWDEVHSERDRLGADQVSLVGAFHGSGGPTGVGFFRANEDSAFTVTKASAFDQYTFVHELGHNLWLDHSDGFVNRRGRFTTIMALASYKRILRFSNPDVHFYGHRTGDGSHNEVAIINENAWRVASFR